MHQHPRPRPAPRDSSGATSPATNPERTNNPRDRPFARSRSSQELASYSDRIPSGSGGRTDTDRVPSEGHGGASAGGGGASQEYRETTKLNQIIQNFHSKAALAICSARANLPQAYNKSGELKRNRWFNMILDDTDVLSSDLAEWKRPDLADRRPPPLVIEVFLDTTHLNQSQALVVLDENGKRWDVSDALTPPADSSPPRTKNGARFCEVLLERWTMELGDPAGFTAAELNDQLPNVYKKGVVLFRSLYAFLRFLPAWRLHRRLARTPGSHQALKLKFRIRQKPSTNSQGKDGLFTPLVPSEYSNRKAGDTSTYVEQHKFADLRCPAGPFSIRVAYRRNADFSVADAESLLSSRFLGLDEGLPTLQVGRSLPGARPRADTAQTRYGSAIDSSTTSRQSINREPRGLLGAYGSLGTYHGTGKRGSPVNDLRTRTIESGSGSSVERGSEIQTAADNERRNSYGRFGGKSPFKAGSLESSTSERLASLPRGISSPRPPSTFSASVDSRYTGSSPARNFLTEVSEQKGEIRSIGRPGYTSRKRDSLSTLPESTFRPTSLQNEPVASGSGSYSPRPTPPHKYSSSFNRPPRTTQGSGRSGESAGSSTRNSATDAAGQASPQPTNSPADVDPSLLTFISFLTDAPEIKDVDLSRHSASGGHGGHSVNLSKYSGLRDNNTQLAEEISASSLIQTSSTPPSRRLSNVPGLSTSSSPSRALASFPHGRSRLSTQSIAEEVNRSSGGSESPHHIHEEDEGDDEPFIFPINEA